MAIGIENITNTGPTSSDYPKGRIVDDPAGFNGTPINQQSMDDIFQTFMRVLAQNGITANGTADNVTHGYQYALGLGVEAWTTGSAVTGYTNNSPTALFTIDTGDITFNKFHRHGKTFDWHLKIDSATITNAPTALFVTPPMSLTWARASKMFGLYNGTTVVIVELTGSGAGDIKITLPGGGAFTNGTNNQSLDICIRAEIN